MKNIFVILFFTILLTANVAGQKKISPPVPVAPKVDGNLMFIEVMSDEEEKEYLKSLSPNLRADLEEIKKLDKERYYQLLREAHFTRFDFPFMDKKDKERVELDKKILEYDISTEALGLKYQKANDSEKSKLKSDLMKKLGDLFELKEQERKIEVALLQKEIEELKKSLEVRKNNKDAILLKRFNELVGAGDYLDWD